MRHLDAAYCWLCHQRRDFPATADGWHLRRHRPSERQRLQAELRAGTMRLGPLSIITPADREPLHLWGARDALILKALALAVAPRLVLSPHCVHVKGHGSLKAAVRRVQQQLGGNEYVLRTDVKGFYESIDQRQLLAQLSARIQRPGLIELLRQAIERSVERGGLWRDIRTGISRGCPLSPLLGALYLKALDNRLAGKRLFYVRYMDDILVLTRTHGQLRRAVRTLNRTFEELKLAQAPDKTFIGRIARGFDFLGYSFSRVALALAPRTLEKHAARWHRLYEQQKHKAAPVGAAVLDAYVLRWERWCRAGLDGLLGKSTGAMPTTALRPAQGNTGYPKQCQRRGLGNRRRGAPHGVCKLRRHRQIEVPVSICVAGGGTGCKGAKPRYGHSQDGNRVRDFVWG
jgi:hypothetical protein